MAPGSWISFGLFRNTGIAFSIPVPDMLFWSVALPVFAGLVAVFRNFRKHDPAAASMIFIALAGAVSNLMDRIRHGVTIDYFLLFDFSAINLADVMIVGGIASALFLYGKRGSADRIA